jgi:hypothetical protein
MPTRFLPNYEQLALLNSCALHTSAHHQNLFQAAGLVIGEQHACAHGLHHLRQLQVMP